VSVIRNKKDSTCDYAVLCIVASKMLVCGSKCVVYCTCAGDPKGSLPLDHIIKTHLYTYSRQIVSGSELVLEVAHCHIVLVLRYCNFMLVNICILEC
jgi:hypothetical protein